MFSKMQKFTPVKRFGILRQKDLFFPESNFAFTSTFFRLWEPLKSKLMSCMDTTEVHSYATVSTGHRKFPNTVFTIITTVFLQILRNFTF